MAKIYDLDQCATGGGGSGGDGYPVGANSAVTTIPASITAVSLLASNASRKSVHVANDSSGTMYILYGSGVTATNWTYRLNRRDTVDFTDYRGAVTAIWSNTNNSAQITEVT